ncbi:DUF4747 family protein [Pseudomonas nitroreducens]|uniref:DUF4747 family protein n=1 Tax=Rhizophagus irregularis (strain DAOM 181602 / DAOM 197198 / MUCL 43194) TaxID=747089 RepID=U9TBF8_RHIID|nr:DUF4747 family protein [Pseudomonas nitroreducens]
MARVRTSAIHIGALNVVLQPHSPELYLRMFMTLAKGKFDARVRGDDAILLGSCHYLDKDNPLMGGRGDLYKFLKLDATEAWFNTREMDEASEDDVAELNIPDYLKPHFRKFQYIFFPKGHRMYIITKKAKQSLSQDQVKRFLTTVFERAEFAGFGQLSVTVQPDPNGLLEMLSLKRISKLRMEIDRPNPDDHEDLEEEILRRLNRMNARTEKLEYLEASNTGLVVDEEVRALADVAKDNGFVYVEGKDADNVKQYLSTKNMPLHVTARYNPNLMSEFDAFYDKVVEVNQDILRAQ